MIPYLKRVVLESPYASDPEFNVRYGRICLRDSLMRGEAPIASHLLYARLEALDDDDPKERDLGMKAGHAWYTVSHGAVVYCDFGISPGMIAGVTKAIMLCKSVEVRLVSAECWALLGGAAFAYYTRRGLIAVAPSIHASPVFCSRATINAVRDAADAIIEAAKRCG